MLIRIASDDQVEVGGTNTTEPGVTIDVDVPEYGFPGVNVDGEPDEFGYVVGGLLSELEDERLSREMGQPVSASVAPPDPWLIALAVLIWEGIVQGAAWDVTKIALERAMSSLQAKGVAPTSPDDRTTKSGLRVNWSSYLDVRNLFSLHCKLEIEYRKKVHGADVDDVSLTKKRKRK